MFHMYLKEMNDLGLIIWNESYPPCHQREWQCVYSHLRQEPLNRFHSLVFVLYESMQTRYSIDQQSP